MKLLNNFPLPTECITEVYFVTFSFSSEWMDEGAL